MASSPYEVSRNEAPGPYDFRAEAMREQGVSTWGWLDRPVEDVQVGQYSYSPILRSIAPTISEVRDCLDAHVEDIPNFSGMSRRAIRAIFSDSPIKVDPPTQLFNMLGGLYEQRSEDVPIRDFLEDTLERHHAGIKSIDMVADRIEEDQAFKKQLVETTGNVVDRLEEVAGSDSRHAYLVAKMLTTHISELEEEDTFYAQTSVAIGAGVNSANLFRDLGDRIKVGECDEHLARDILLKNREASKNKDTPLKGIDLEISNMIELASSMAPEKTESEIIVALSQPAAAEKWGQPARKHLATEREQLIERLERTYRRMRNYYAVDLRFSNVVSDEALARFFSNHPEHRVMYNRARGLPPTLGLNGNNGNRKRKPQRQHTTGSVALKGAKQERKKEIKRNLFYVSGTGELHPEGSPKFQKMIKNYTSKHGDRDLHSVAQGVLDYYRSTPRVDGIIGGLSVTTNAALMLETEKGAKKRHPVFRLRTNQAQLPPGTPSELRAYAVVRGEDVYILGITNKPEVDKLAHKYGIPLS